MLLLQPLLLLKLLLLCLQCGLLLLGSLLLLMLLHEPELCLQLVQHLLLLGSQVGLALKELQSLHLLRGQVEVGLWSLLGRDGAVSVMTDTLLPRVWPSLTLIAGVLEATSVHLSSVRPGHYLNSNPLAFYIQGAL